MRCLITGASGLVGANLVEAAGLRGWQVRAMHRKSSNLKALAGLSFETALGDVTEPLCAGCPASSDRRFFPYQMKRGIAKRLI